LQIASELNPGNPSIARVIKNMKLSCELKEKASELFKKQEF